MSSPPPPPVAPRPPWRFQFGLKSMLAVMALLSVMSAALGGMLRNTMTGVVMALAAPVGLVVLAGVVRFAMQVAESIRNRDDL